MVLLKEIEEIVARHKSCLPTQVNAASVSVKAKTPFIALIYRESLYYRHTQLCEAALRLVAQEMPTPATVLGRAAMECTGMIYWANKKLLSYKNDATLPELQDFFCKALMGSRAEEYLPKAHSALTGIDHADKEFAGFRKLYDDLSEFAHPNYAGVHHSYANIDYGQHVVNFENNSNPASYQYTMAVGAIGGSLSVFEAYYNAMGKEMPDFIKWCESLLDEA